MFKKHQLYWKSISEIQFVSITYTRAEQFLTLNLRKSDNRMYKWFSGNWTMSDLL